MAQSDYLLKIEGIKGESTDSKHPDEIEISSWAWGATQTGTYAYGGGGGAGKVNMRDFLFTMKSNQGSPNLMLACATGKNFPKAVFTCRKAGGEAQQDFLVYTFTNLIISSFSAGGPAQGNGDPVPLETITFNFEQIEMEYKKQDSSGKVTAPVKAGWNLKTNKKV